MNESEWAIGRRKTRGPEEGAAVAGIGTLKRRGVDLTQVERNTERERGAAE